MKTNGLEHKKICNSCLNVYINTLGHHHFNIAKSFNITTKQGHTHNLHSGLSSCRAKNLGKIIAAKMESIFIRIF